MGTNFQIAMGMMGILTVPIDSQSFCQNGKTERAGDSLNKQRWDMGEEFHIAGRRDFEDAVLECFHNII